MVPKALVITDLACVLNIGHHANHEIMFILFECGICVGFLLILQKRPSSPTAQMNICNKTLLED